MYLRVFKNLGFELLQTEPERHHVLVDAPTDLKLPGETRITDKSPELAPDSIDQIVVSLRSPSLVRHSDKLVAHSHHAHLYVPLEMERFLGHARRHRHLWEHELKTDDDLPVSVKVLGRPNMKGVKRFVKTWTHRIGSFIAGTVVKRSSLLLEFEESRWGIQGTMFQTTEDVQLQCDQRRAAVESEGLDYFLAFPTTDNLLAELVASLPADCILLVGDGDCDKVIHEPLRNNETGEQLGGYFRVPVNEWIDLDDELKGS